MGFRLNDVASRPPRVSPLVVVISIAGATVVRPGARWLHGAGAAPYSSSVTCFTPPRGIALLVDLEHRDVGQ